MWAALFPQGEHALRSVPPCRPTLPINQIAQAYLEYLEAAPRAREEDLFRVFASGLWPWLQTVLLAQAPAATSNK